VTETYPPEINGVASTLARLVSGLRARGYRVSVVRPRQPAADSAGGDGEPGLTLVRGARLPGYPGLRLGWPAPRLLRRDWTRHCPDVVYVATEGPLGWSAVRTARQLGVPVVSGFHTNFHVYARHYHLGWLRPLVFHYLRRFHNRTRTTLVASLDLHAHLTGLGFRNLDVLGRGVDRDLFTPARRSAALRAAWGAAAQDLVVLSVGRLAPEKNLLLAIAAFRAIEQTGAARRFVLVGDGPLRTSLQAAHPDLLFAGARTGEALAEHYASADLLLFPSMTETFGNVTLEALASGLAVVAYDYAAAARHIRHEETGVLVPCGDARAFVREAAALAASPLVVQRMRRQARLAVAGLDWSRVIERFATSLTVARADGRGRRQTTTASSARVARA
jgi:glycosyltransferase involved in cell wall biosynthesis